ncbi:MAG: agmatine deiminase family protein [bacterium]
MIKRSTDQEGLNLFNIPPKKERNGSARAMRLVVDALHCRFARSRLNIRQRNRLFLMTLAVSLLLSACSTPPPLGHQESSQPTQVVDLPKSQRPFIDYVDPTDHLLLAPTSVNRNICIAIKGQQANDSALRSTSISTTEREHAYAQVQKALQECTAEQLQYFAKLAKEANSVGISVVVVGSSRERLQQLRDAGVSLVNPLTLPISIAGDQWIRDFGALFYFNNNGGIELIDPSLSPPFSNDEKYTQTADQFTKQLLGMTSIPEAGTLGRAGPGGNFLVTTLPGKPEVLCIVMGTRRPDESEEAARIDINKVLSPLGCVNTEVLPYVRTWGDPTQNPERELNMTPHADMLVRPGEGKTMLVGYYKDSFYFGPNNADLKVYMDTVSERFRDRGYEVLRIPMPPPVLFDNKWRLQSRLNATVLRGSRGDVVLVPLYGAEAEDKEALALYQQAFPSFSIVGTPVPKTISYLGGANHCVTSQAPWLDFFAPTPTASKSIPGGRDQKALIRSQQPSQRNR